MEEERTIREEGGIIPACVEDAVPLSVTDVVVSAEYVASMDKSDIDEVISRLGVALREAEDTGYYVLGAMLHAVYYRQLYLELEFDQFEAYCKDRLGFGLRKAFYLMAIWEKFEKELQIPRSDYKDIEWSKLKEIVSIVNSENVYQWLAKARTSTTEELRYLVRKELAEPGEEVERTIAFSIYLFPGEKEVVIRAFDTARKMLPHYDDKEPRQGQLFEMICADFLAGAEMEQ
jgi:hypothetical protein